MLKTQSIFKLSFLSLILSFLMSGCALFVEQKGPATTYSPASKVYYSSFEKVWRASQIALQNYPMSVNNMDKGFLQTELIKGKNIWYSPYQKKKYPNGYRYRINLRIIKGNVKNKNAIRVSIQKQAFVQNNFFSDPTKVPTDHMEEKILLYRIKRELIVDKALQRAQKQINEDNI